MQCLFGQPQRSLVLHPNALKNLRASAKSCNLLGLCAGTAPPGQCSHELICKVCSNGKVPTVYLHFSRMVPIQRYHHEVSMKSNNSTMLSLRALAQRWNRSEIAISVASAVGLGPRFCKIDGKVMYRLDDVQRFERACLFFDPAEVALRQGL